MSADCHLPAKQHTGRAKRRSADLYRRIASAEFYRRVTSAEFYRRIQFPEAS